MVTYPPYKSLLVTCLLVLALSFLFNGLISNQRSSVDVTDIADDYTTIEGYVVSKRIDTIWLANEPVSVWGRLTGYFTSNYGKESIIVSKHNDTENHNLFNDLKINQEVRVYGDYLRESLPGKISAYYIEIINND